MTNIEFVTENDHNDSIADDVVDTQGVRSFLDGIDDENETTQTTSKEPVESIPTNEQVLNKPVKKLTKREREQLLREYEDGIDNKYYKVDKMNNGSMRITKRANPLGDVDNAHETVSSKIDTRFGKRLTNDQLLLEHIIDLEKRCEIMRMKHKKLKKRYNKLERDIFEDESDDDIDNRVSEVKYNENPVETPVEQPHQRPMPRPVPIPNTIATPRPISARRFVGKPSWRSVVSSF